MLTGTIISGFMAYLNINSQLNIDSSHKNCLKKCWQSALYKSGYEALSFVVISFCYFVTRYCIYAFSLNLIAIFIHKISFTKDK